METFVGSETLPQFEDRVLYYLVELTGDLPLPLEKGIHEGDLLKHLAGELGVSADYAQDPQFSSSDARSILLASILQLKKEGLVEARVTFEHSTIRPTRAGRLRVNQWREKWKKDQQITSGSSSTQAPPHEVQEAWVEVARLRKELQLVSRTSSQPHMTAESTLPIHIFFSYAHEDQILRDELEKHLANFKKQRLIVGWNDREITPGKEWRQEIDTKLNTAQIILLLVSPDFMHSDYCYSIEMERAIAQHEAHEAIVIPIILRPVDWEDAPFSKLQALPTAGKPITSWSNPDEAFLDVARGIRKVVTEMLAGGRVPQTSPSSESRSISRLTSTAPDFKVLTSPIFQPDMPYRIDVNATEQPLTIKNIGKENAYDICAVLFGCETSIVPQTMPQNRLDGTNDFHWREISRCPVEPGATLVLRLQRREGLLHGSQRMGNYTFYAAQEPNLEEIMHESNLPFSSARLTLTYRDGSQQKYMQTFDYQHTRKAWAYLSRPEHVVVDLLDILLQAK